MKKLTVLALLATGCIDGESTPCDEMQATLRHVTNFSARFSDHARDSLAMATADVCAEATTDTIQADSTGDNR